MKHALFALLILAAFTSPALAQEKETVHTALEKYKARGGTYEIVQVKMAGQKVCFRTEIPLDDNHFLAIGSDGCFGKFYTHPEGFGRITTLSAAAAIEALNNAGPAAIATEPIKEASAAPYQ